MAAPYDAATVANRFIERAREQGKPISPMKIIKLVYIAHGFSLAINRRPLVGESVEAWRYGPVIPSLYRRLKHYGSGNVESLVPSSMFRGNEQLSDEDRRLVDIVYDKYEKFTAIQLSHLTHRSGTPWETTYRPDEFGLDIDDSVIRSHYATLLSK